MFTLWEFNIGMENCQFMHNLPAKEHDVFFHSYVKLPEGTQG